MSKYHLSNDTAPRKIQVFHLISCLGYFTSTQVSASFRANGPKIWDNCPFTEGSMFATAKAEHRTMELILSLNQCHTPLNHTKKIKI